ncbi:MAG: hypothetical protein N2379_10835 [Verrucomicrobiae bacterium]|nr:hypothetical protein [Verrucomicrobiae bacterium]
MQKTHPAVAARERWFEMVTGEKIEPTARSTEKLAERATLPESVARELASQLEV